MFFFFLQIVLEEAGRPMHIKEIKQRIIDRGLVQSKYNKLLVLTALRKQNICYKC